MNYNTLTDYEFLYDLLQIGCEIICFVNNDIATCKIIPTASGLIIICLCVGVLFFSTSNSKEKFITECQNNNVKFILP